MSLIKHLKSYMRLLSTPEYNDLVKYVEQSVDMNAKNTENFKSKDLAEMQISDLADKVIKRRDILK